jgi:hypothetical protein
VSIQTDLEAQLVLVNAAITAELTAGTLPNWSVGQVRFDNNSKLTSLYEQRDALLKQIRSIPSEAINTVQSDVDVLGHDGAQYLGDED